MSDKEMERLMDADRMLRYELPIPEMRAMFDGTILTIELVRGFEIFNSRPYHNYEDWGDGYRITYGDVKVGAEDLDDALARLREELVKKIRAAQPATLEEAAASRDWWVLPDGRLGHPGWCPEHRGEDGKLLHRVVWMRDPSVEPGFYPRNLYFNEDGTPHPVDEKIPGHHRWKYRLPDGTVGQTGTCRSCPATIIWIKTKAGKAAPMNPDGTSHFASCPGAERWKGAHRRDAGGADT